MHNQVNTLIAQAPTALSETLVRFDDLNMEIPRPYTLIHITLQRNNRTLISIRFIRSMEAGAGCVPIVTSAFRLRLKKNLFRHYFGAQIVQVLGLGNR